MSDVNETLQQLLVRRLLEMGKERGRDEPLSLNEVYGSLPADGDWVTREAVRRVLVDGHANIGGKAARTIATMFDLTEGEVLEAAGKRAPLGPFELPEEANRLDARERRAVLQVIDAILAAGERPTSASPEVLSDEADVLSPDEAQDQALDRGRPR